MKPFNRFVCPALVLTAFILLTGCSILPKAEPSDIYRLPASQASASAGTPVSWSLRLASPQASEVLNSPKIAVIPQGNLFSSYAASRWSDPAPVLLRNTRARPPAWWFAWMHCWCVVSTSASWPAAASRCASP
jgi:cholesterol transport system auxiliary component